MSIDCHTYNHDNNTFLGRLYRKTGRRRTNTVGTQGEKAKGPQIIDIICYLRYLKHPRLVDRIASRSLHRDGTRDGTQTFPPPYLRGYAKSERSRICFFAGASRLVIVGNAPIWVMPAEP
jgi:hypothetical protein